MSVRSLAAGALRGLARLIVPAPPAPAHPLTEDDVASDRFLRRQQARAVGQARREARLGA